MPSPRAVFKVEPSIRVAATPEEALTTLEATECHLRAKSVKHLITLDFPVPPDPAKNNTSCLECGNKAVM